MYTYTHAAKWPSSQTPTPVLLAVALGQLLSDRHQPETPQLPSVPVNFSPPHAASLKSEQEAEAVL